MSRTCLSSFHSAFVSRWESSVLALGLLAVHHQLPAARARPRHWLSSLRPSHSLCPPFPPLTFWPYLGQSVLPSNCQTGACGHLSVSVLCPTPPLAPLSPLQPPTGVGLLVYHPRPLHQLYLPKADLTALTHTPIDTHIPATVTSNSPPAPAVLQLVTSL